MPDRRNELPPGPGPRIPPRLALLIMAALLVLLWLGIRACVAGPPVREASAQAWAGLAVDTLGDLEATGAPVVILLHGYGADKGDLAPLARRLKLGDQVRVVLPAAPLPRKGGGRAWWPLDFDALQRARARDDAWTRAVPEGLPAARARVLALLEDVHMRLGTPPERTAIVGFSQGAMLAMDTALHADPPLAAVASLSGALLAEPVWRPRMEAKRSTRMLLSHGRGDSVVPFDASARLRRLLEQAGAEVTWLPFEGGHHIPAEVSDRLAIFLRNALPEAPGAVPEEGLLPTAAPAGDL